MSQQQAHQEYDYQFKIVMVGDRAVGKSNILLRYMNNKFDENTQATLGVEFSSKYIRTADGNSVIRA